MRIAVVGMGYVGLISALTLCEIGHDVIGIDINEQKILMLNNSKNPIYEPNSEYLIHQYRQTGKINFTDNYKLISTCDAVYICVNAELNDNFGFSYEELGTAVKSASPFLQEQSPLIIRTTVEPGTCEVLFNYLSKQLPFNKLRLIYLPEFSKEGEAIENSLKPERIVVGCLSNEDADFIHSIYGKICDNILSTDWVSAELIKLSANNFIALKISYINTIARLADSLGANIDDVSLALALDSRIGKGALGAGIGWGGSCLPKDALAFNKILEDNEIDNRLISNSININDSQIVYLVNKMEKVMNGLKGKEIAVLGLTFKANTDDIRNSKSIDLIKYLTMKGAFVKYYDPIRNDKIPGLKGDHLVDIDKALAYSQAIVVATEWKDFINMNWEDVKNLMDGKLVVDARNCLNKYDVESVGLTYLGIGR
jgi:UDPglucose 6-dehydrogenase